MQFSIIDSLQVIVDFLYCKQFKGQFRRLDMKMLLETLQKQRIKNKMKYFSPLA